MAEISTAQAGTGIPRPAAPFTCGGCDATWGGVTRAHCGDCHRTFAGASGFDLHRSTRGEHGGCIDPATIVNRKTGSRVLELRNGLWSAPEMTEEQKAQRFGRAA